MKNLMGDIYTPLPACCFLSVHNMAEGGKVQSVVDMIVVEKDGNLVPALSADHCKAKVLQVLTVGTGRNAETLVTRYSATRRVRWVFGEGLPFVESSSPGRLVRFNAEVELVHSTERLVAFDLHFRSIHDGRNIVLPAELHYEDLLEITKYYRTSAEYYADVPRPDSSYAKLEELPRYFGLETLDQLFATHGQSAE